MHSCELLSVCSQTDVGNHFLSRSLQAALTQEGFRAATYDWLLVWVIEIFVLENSEGFEV